MNGLSFLSPALPRYGSGLGFFYTHSDFSILVGTVCIFNLHGHIVFGQA